MPINICEYHETILGIVWVMENLESRRISEFHFPGSESCGKVV